MPHSFQMIAGRLAGSARRAGRKAAFAVALVCAAEAGAQAPDVARARDTTDVRRIDTIRVVGRIDDLVGVAVTASEGRVGAVDLRARPILREGELLETIPGMIVTQHSGDGKANQYFVRGFNLDHGTDFQTRLEGMPLNMPTHGHGQGYTDLSPIIPELVDHLEYRLGVAHAEIGDFGSAGGAQFRLVRALPRPFAVLEAGQHGFGRVAAGASPRAGAGTVLVAGEARAYDGPWDRPQELRKLAGVARWSEQRGASRFSLLAMGYGNRWNASDQIPRRAVADGRLSRFGQVDSTDGGSSRRLSLSAAWERFGSRDAQEVQLYVVRSNLDLFSNFTYFADDPTRGDQFAQRDHRTVVGANAQHSWSADLRGVTHRARAGVQTRTDIIDGLGLARTVERVRVASVRDDQVWQGNGGVFVEAESRWQPRLRTVLGLRADGVAFDVQSDRAENSGRGREGILSPKASLVLTPSDALELYASGGLAFHSNDARGATITVDPVSGDEAARVDPLVRSRGAEVGARVAAGSVRATATAWLLHLESELVFVGDAGATEPSAASRRNGVTLATFWRPTPSLAVDADLSMAGARFVAVPADQRAIPGALEHVLAAGITRLPASHGAFWALRLRHFGAYPLVEDNSVRARPSTLLNGDVGVRLRSGLRLQATVLNLSDREVDDIQYFYASRLRGEPARVEDTHFHPAEPRQVRISMAWGF